GNMRTQLLLPPGFADTQHVEADAGHDGGEPTAEIFDLSGIGAVEPQPGFLNRVFRLAARAQHPVGHRAQMPPISLEPVRQKILFAHRSHPGVPFRHSTDEPPRPNVTSAGTTMSKSQKEISDATTNEQSGLAQSRRHEGARRAE